MDRGAEKQALHEVLDSVRRGMSGALVLRGEPGVGAHGVHNQRAPRVRRVVGARCMQGAAVNEGGGAAAHGQ